jgi:phosphatidylserine decarboxylase
MSKTLRDWINEDVANTRARPVRFLVERHFFRDPCRPIYSDPALFFSPADGVIIYVRTAYPDEPLLNIKGKPYSTRTALRDEHFDQPSLVIGIFMTFYDVHVNRVPYAGHLTYRELEPINSFNLPMLDVEKDLLDQIEHFSQHAGYLFTNQRVVNHIYSLELEQPYYVLQIADYDVDSITPFRIKQHQHFAQNQRFSQIRFGSQVDLIIPLSKRFDYRPLVAPGLHVEAGIDPLVRIVEKNGPQHKRMH